MQKKHLARIVSDLSAQERDRALARIEERLSKGEQPKEGCLPIAGRRAIILQILLEKR